MFRRCATKHRVSNRHPCLQQWSHVLQVGGDVHNGALLRRAQHQNLAAVDAGIREKRLAVGAHKHLPSEGPSTAPLPTRAAPPRRGLDPIAQFAVETAGGATGASSVS